MLFVIILLFFWLFSVTIFIPFIHHEFGQSDSLFQILLHIHQVFQLKLLLFAPLFIIVKLFGLCPHPVLLSPCVIRLLPSIILLWIVLELLEVYLLRI